MRHFLRRRLGHAHSVLSRGVLACSLARALIGGASAADGLATADRAAVASAVDLAVITRRTHADLGAASCTEIEAKAVVDVARILGRWGRQRTCPTHASGRSCASNAMAKIGRNEACPCGSGKKHKRCCLAAPAPPKGAATITDGPSESHHENCDGCLDELNERADRVLDVLLDGRIHDAVRLCHDFIRDFPGQAEGIDLLSMIFEERGQRERALELLRQASAIAHASPDYDAETRSLMRARIVELELSGCSRLAVRNSKSA